jgi:hypothetical protein
MKRIGFEQTQYLSASSTRGRRDGQKDLLGSRLIDHLLDMLGLERASLR